MATTVPRSIGAPLRRVEGREKVTGAARYAYEQPADEVTYCWIVQSTVAKGEVRSVDASGALAQPGVVAVISHENAPSLEEVDDGELAVLQSSAVAYRGQIVAAVVAETLEAARGAASLVRVEYDAGSHDVELRADHPKLYKPDKVNPSYEADSVIGDVDAALASAAHVSDQTYETPAFHNSPLEPHATVALWQGGDLTDH